ncbi:MAG: tetratricopeptide repeat protein, partial [Calditrichaeota bacterium]|nr:tetratricopeptide repeat protein [Calditrichota bacterium]
MKATHRTTILAIAVGVAVLGACLALADDQDKKALYDQKVLELKELTAQMQAPGVTPDQYKEMKAKYDELSAEIEALGKELLQDKALQERQAAAKRAYNEGNTFAKTGRYEEALKAYDQAIAQDSSFAKAFYGRGLALSNLRRYDEALAAYQRAIALDPMYDEAYTALGNLFQKMGKYQEAVEVYNKAINYNPQNPKAYYNLGAVYQNYLKDPAKAA